MAFVGVGAGRAEGAPGQGRSRARGRWWAGLVGAGLCFGAGAAQAQDLSADPLVPDASRAVVDLGGGHRLALIGEFRLVGGHADGQSVVVDDPALPDRTPDDDFGQLRLRVRPAYIYLSSGIFSVYKVALDAEVSTYGSSDDPPQALRYDPHWQFRRDDQGIRLTQAYAMAAGRFGALKAGLVRAQFGLGAVANAGEDAPTDSVAQSPFGYAREHDRNLRAQLAVFPFEPVTRRGQSQVPLALVVAADRVIDDDTANYDDGDRASQIMGGALVRLGDFRLAAGMLKRHQTYAEGGRTDVWLAALSGRYDWFRKGHRLWVEGEFASYFGDTTLVQSPTVAGPFDVQATGWVARAGYARSAVETVVELGYASGDSNPFDNQVRNFTFDREHRVGLLMFNESLRQQTAVGAYNAADPRLRGNPTRGFDQVATGGAVQNAIYLNPRAAFQMGRGLTLLAGYLYGRSEEPVADPFQSGVQGGLPVAWRGRKNARELGHEVDVGLGYTRRMGPFEGRFKVQYAWFAPGEAFDGPNGEAAPNVVGAQVQTEVRW